MITHLAGVVDEFQVIVQVKVHYCNAKTKVKICPSVEFPKVYPLDM